MRRIPYIGQHFVKSWDRSDILKRLECFVPGDMTFQVEACWCWNLLLVRGEAMACARQGLDNFHLPPTGALLFRTKNLLDQGSSLTRELPL